MSEGWAWAMASMIFGGALVVRIGCEYLNRFADEYAGRPARLFRELASDGETWWFRGEDNGGRDGR